MSTTYALAADFCRSLIADHDIVLGLYCSPLAPYRRRCTTEVTGGQQYNSPHHSGQDNGDRNDVNQDEAVRTAQEHGSSDNSDIFSNALSFVSGNKQKHSEPVDEESVTKAHAQVYGDSDSSVPMPSAALQLCRQVLKKFTSGGESAGGGSQTQLISLAMAEATKLFDQNGAGSGNKQDAVNGAAMTVMKLLVQSKFSGAVGGGNSGGLGGLMSLAQQFGK
uniref:Beta-flanking protein n=1 Tax=Pholiota microspora TaxID=1538424 RepID=B9A1Q9_PHOMI|nr:beta-flanking protein [Pholiota nameko]